MRVLLIDNHDSFTRNLEHLLATAFGLPPEIVTWGRVDFDVLKEYDLVCISPGPGHPDDYPGYGDVFESGRPVLGICLGMQLLGRHFGGKVERLPDCIHGARDEIEFDGRSFEVARYHSLHLTDVPECFEVLCRNRQGVAMAVRHRTRKLIGFQFHPESFMTSEGSYFIDYARRTFHLNRP